MINLEQYLLIQLMEECSEVQQACAKALRFGLADGYPGTNRTNYMDIFKEIQDVHGVLQVLDEYAVISKYIDLDSVNAKVLRIHEYMQISRNIGILE